MSRSNTGPGPGPGSAKSSCTGPGPDLRGVLDSVHVIGVGSRLSLRLALVLEPDRNRFYFPAIPDNGSRLSV
jgi:hypothetical protein